MRYYNESPAEQVFRQFGPFVHLYTKPLEHNVYFHDKQDRTVAINFLSIAVSQSGCRLLAFAFMSNHFHFILRGTPREIDIFREEFSRRFMQYVHRRGILQDEMTATVNPINDVRQLRTEIAYVLRNPFVVRSDIHVFANPWTSGHLYFNPLLPHEGTPVSQLKGRASRNFFRSHQPAEINSGIMVKDGEAQLWSFVDYQLVESLFDNARQFIYSVLKNVESLARIAEKLGEKASFSDEELLPQTLKLCREKFHAENIQALSAPDKIQLAQCLKFEYSASNKQIARLLKSPIDEVDALFPLSSCERQTDQCPTFPEQ